MNTSTEKHVLITGGTSGIGRATAIAFKHAGYRVTATGVTAREVTECRGDPLLADITFIELNVANSEAIARVMGALPQLDVLVNAAGVPRGANEFSEQEFMRTIDINLHGSMRCCYAAQPLLARQGGAIVNIASMMSFFGSPTGPGYAASKGAIVQLTKSLAVAWAEQNIRTNAVAPGWIDTPMTRGLQTDTQRYSQVLTRTPMHRWGRPDEIAQGILFLASPAASFINGAVLPIDGGYLCNGF